MGLSISWIFPVAGWILFIWTGLNYFKIASPHEIFISLSGVTFFSIWGVSCLWGSNFQNPLYLEGLALGYGHIDILFHSGIAQMIRTYGIPGTGVDGIAWMHYHAGSHWFFAQLSALLNISLLDFYNFGFGTVMNPLFFYATLNLALEVVRLKKIRFSVCPDTVSGKMFWLIFLVIHIHLLPPTLLSKANLWNQYLIIESYCTALTLLFLVLPVILDLFMQIKKGAALHVQSVLSWIFLPFMVAVIGYCKNSVMLLLITGMAYAFVRTMLWKNGLALVSMFITTVLGFWMYRATVSPMYDSPQFALFHFIKTSNRLSPLVLFFILYFLFLLAYLILRTVQLRIQSLKTLKQSIRGLKTLDLEILILISVVGMLPGMLIRIPMSSGHFFADVQNRIAVLLLLSAFPAWMGSNLLAWKKWKWIGLVLIIICAGNTVIAAKKMIGMNLQYRYSMVGQTGRTGKTFVKDLFSTTSFSDLKKSVLSSPFKSIEKTRRYIFLTRLRTLDILPRREKARSLVFIPQTDTLYWNSFGVRVPKQGISFIVPAVSGIAMIDGFPPLGVKTYYYGFYNYAPRKENTPQENLQIRLCQMAEKKNFKNCRIMTLTVSNPEPVEFNCADTVRNPYP